MVPEVSKDRDPVFMLFHADAFENKIRVRRHCDEDIHAIVHFPCGFVPLSWTEFKTRVFV